MNVRQVAIFDLFISVPLIVAHVILTCVILILIAKNPKLMEQMAEPSIKDAQPTKPPIYFGSGKIDIRNSTLLDKPGMVRIIFGVGCAFMLLHVLRIIAACLILKGKGDSVGCLYFWLVVNVGFNSLCLWDQLNGNIFFERSYQFAAAWAFSMSVCNWVIICHCRNILKTASSTCFVAAGVAKKMKGN